MEYTRPSLTTHNMENWDRISLAQSATPSLGRLQSLSQNCKSPEGHFVIAQSEQKYVCILILAVCDKYTAFSCKPQKSRRRKQVTGRDKQQQSLLQACTQVIAESLNFNLHIIYLERARKCTEQTQDMLQNKASSLSWPKLVLHHGHL